MATLMLFDYDGVLNALPFTAVWTGPADVDPDFLDEKNWGYKRVDIDPDLYFAPDNEVTVLNDQFDPPRPFKIRWSSELLMKIQALVDEGLIEFKFLSTWRDRTQTILRSVMGFEESWSWVQWTQKFTGGEWGKYTAIERLIEEEGERRPIVWVDDVATEHVQNYAEVESYEEEGSHAHSDWFVGMEDENVDVFTANKVDALVIQTETKFGLSRAHWAAIEDFVRAHA